MSATRSLRRPLQPDSRMGTGAAQAALSMLDSNSTHMILRHLDAKALVLTAATCRSLHDSVFNDTAVWREQCERLLGPAAVALHAGAAPISDAHAQLPASDMQPSEATQHVVTRRFNEHKGCQEARFWTRLWAAADRMECGYYWDTGRQRLDASVPEELKGDLARGGHTATEVGRHIVYAGGILLQGRATMDVLILDAANYSMHRPKELGEAPASRFRHTAVSVEVPANSELHDALHAALSSFGVDAADAAEGSLVLLYGGYNTRGDVFGGPDIQGLWVAAGGKTVAWVQLSATGDVPTPRFHHTADGFDGGRQMVVFGGEGRDHADMTRDGRPSAFVLDVPVLTWRRTDTTAQAPRACPGGCALHLSAVRVCPESSREELVVVTVTEDVGDMRPFTLDLTSFCWRDGPWREHEAHVALPPARSRPGATRVAGKWLLVTEGFPPIVQNALGDSGRALAEINRLHLPSLTWRGGMSLDPVASAPIRRGAGLTANGLVLFGGVELTDAGVTPIARNDVLLIGPPPAGALQAEAEARPPREEAACSPQPAAKPSMWLPPRGDGSGCRLSAGVHADMEAVLAQVLSRCNAQGPRTCKHCGRQPLIMALAGVLATYAAHLKSAKETGAAFCAAKVSAPSWPEGFPEDLQSAAAGKAGKIAPPSVVARMADDKPDPALSLAWFQGIRGYSGSGAEAAADALQQVDASHPQATEPHQPSDLPEELSTNTSAAADQVAEPMSTVAAEPAAAAATADVAQPDASVSSYMASNDSPLQRAATDRPAVSMPAAGLVSSAPAAAPSGAAAPAPDGHIHAATPASQAVAAASATPLPPSPHLARPSSSRRSSCSTQPVTPPPHRLYPPLLPPLPQQQGLPRPPLPYTPSFPGSHEHQRILALQASLARWQHPGMPAYNADPGAAAAASWTHGHAAAVSQGTPLAVYLGYHAALPAAPGGNASGAWAQPSPPPPPRVPRMPQQGLQSWVHAPAPPLGTQSSPHAPQPPGAWPVPGAAAWPQQWQAPPPPPPPLPPQAAQHTAMRMTWPPGQPVMQPLRPPPPPPPPRTQPAATPTLPQPAASQMLSGQSRRSRGGQRRRKTAAAAAAVPAATAAAAVAVVTSASEAAVHAHLLPAKQEAAA